MKMYFSVMENTKPTESEKKQPGGGKYLSHSQRLCFYSPENFTKDVGYETEKRCQQEVNKMERNYNQHRSLYSSPHKFYIEEHDVD